MTISIFGDTLTTMNKESFEREMQAFASLELEPIKVSDSNIGISITMKQLYDCARHFAEYGYEQAKKDLMKDAIDAKCFGIWTDKSLCSIQCSVHFVADGLKIGDIVKVIVIKD